MSGNEGRQEVVFADSNIWLYALLTTQDANKSSKAKAVIRENKLVTSTQVINEVCVNLLRKAAFSEEQISQLINSFYDRHLVGQLDRESLVRASSLRAGHGFSYWDSLMLASALALDARIFYTEDMQDGLLVDNVLRIINPFITKDTPAS
jgi:predicted nucleic acid-binding protein